MKFERPIAIFAFKRPVHLKRVLDVVKSVLPKKLYIYIDRPKESASIEVFKSWEDVKKIISEIDWADELYVDCAEKNLGCKERISSGIKDILTREESAIFLEDDCLPDSSFFSFCDFNLNAFQNNQDVFVITGFNPLNEMTVHSDIIFSDYPHIWGWATWRRFLDVYDVAMSDWESSKDKISKHKRLSKEEQKFWKYFFNKVAKGRVDTWDAQVTYASLIHKKINIYPKLSLIQNIGFDDAGTHVKSENSFSKVFAHQMKEPYKIPESIEINESFDRERAMMEYFLPPLKNRVLNKLRSYLK